jgi:hypothetical protein
MPEGRRAWLREMFTIDLRALAALRVGIALITLWDLACRATQLVAYYTDAGIAPRDVVMTSRTRLMSLYALNGSVSWATTLFAAHALVAVLLLVGFRTRLALATCLVLQWSLMARNTLLVHSGDNLLVWLMIWSLLLPLGAVASVDSRTARSSVSDSAGSEQRAIFPSARLRC